MVFLALFFGFLFFLLDIFFIEALFLPIEISLTLLGLALFLLARQEQAALILALGSGFLIDLTTPGLFFGAMLIWHFVVYLVAKTFLFSFFAQGKKSSKAIFSFLLGGFYFLGREAILSLQTYVLFGQVGPFHWAPIINIILSSLLFCFLVFIAQALARAWHHLLRRYLLIR